MATSSNRREPKGTECRPVRSAIPSLLICALVLAMGATLGVFAQQKPGVQGEKTAPRQQPQVEGVKPLQKPVISATAKTTVKGPHPSLTVEGGNTFDFKEIWGKKKVSHTFTLKNTGDAPLEIKSIKPG